MANEIKYALINEETLQIEFQMLDAASAQALAEADNGITVQAIIRYALVNRDTGLVENVIIWDGVSEYNPGDNFAIVQSDTANIGDHIDLADEIAPLSPPLKA